MQHRPIDQTAVAEATIASVLASLVTATVLGTVSVLSFPCLVAASGVAYLVSSRRRSTLITISVAPQQIPTQDAAFIEHDEPFQIAEPGWAHTHIEDESLAFLNTSQLEPFVMSSYYVTSISYSFSPPLKPVAKRYGLSATFTLEVFNFCDNGDYATGITRLEA